MSNLTQLSAQASAWRTFASPRSRFDVEKKAAEALTFSERRGAKALAVPTKLVGTKEFQENLRHLQDLHGAGLQYAELEVSPDPLEKGEILASWGGLLLGRIQRKHLGWVRPLLATRKLRVFLLAITGGTEGKPTLGCNVVVAGISSAIEAQAPGYGWHVRRKPSTVAEYAA